MPGSDSVLMPSAEMLLWSATVGAMRTRKAVPVESAGLDGTWRVVKANAKKARHSARVDKSEGKTAAL